MFHAFPRLLIPIVLAALPLMAQIHDQEKPVELRSGPVFIFPSPWQTNQTAEAFPEMAVGVQSFAVSLWAEFSHKLGETPIISKSDDRQGWRFLVTPEGALRFEARTQDKADAYTVTTQAGIIAAGSKHHLTLNILRDATKPNAGIWVDGVELASGVVPPVDLFSAQPLELGVAGKKLHLYHRELSRPEVLALQLKASANDKTVAKHSVSSAEAPRFIPQPDETIALIGGTEAVALAESGELEALLLMAFPQFRFHFRSLAWEGDTVFRQDRPLNFGDLGQQLRRVNASTVFIMLGRQECLEAQDLGAFKTAYEKVIRQVQRVTPNIHLIGLLPFEKKSPPLPDLSLKNDFLQAYNSAIRDIALANQAAFGDLYAKPKLCGRELTDFTSDGSNLNAQGLRSLAFRFSDALGFSSDSIMGAHEHFLVMQPDGLAQPLIPLVSAIKAKNHLWHNYWRPTNWAFLHGDRTQQPSSRDPVNPQLRFFPAEQERYLPLLKEAEEKVFKLVEQAQKKLP